MTKHRKPYDHSSAWTASELGNKNAISFQLQEQHITELEAALSRVVQNNIAVEDITQQDFPLASIRKDVKDWVNEIQEGRGLLLLKGFPIEKYSKDDCAKLFYGLGSYFGEAQSQSPMGDRLGHVVDVSGKDTRERAYRNSVELALHTDASDVVGMMSLVKAKQGGLSGYSSGPAIYNRLLETEPELVDVLFEGYQYHLFGEQLPGESPITQDKVPVFSEKEGYLSISYLRSYIELAFEELGKQKSELEERALNTLDDIAHSPEFRLNFMMEPGDIVFFNNYIVLHTRTEFFDHDEPERKRHLLRLWLKARSPRPLVENIDAYGARRGIAKQEGKGTYYEGAAEYRETQPPQNG